MLYSQVIFFIASRIATALEKAAIEEFKTLSPRVLVRVGSLVTKLHDHADAVAGAVPPAYAAHPAAELTTLPVEPALDLESAALAAVDHLAQAAVGAAVQAVGDVWTGGPIADGWTTAVETLPTK